MANNYLDKAGTSYLWNKVKGLADNYVTTTNETTANYVNQIPISTDADGAVYNGTGYKSGYTLNGTGEEATNSGTVISGFIPVTKGDIIRIRDTAATSFDTSLEFALYGSGKATSSGIGKTVANIQGNSVYGTITISGNTATWDTSGISYYFWNDFAYLRVTVNSSNAVVTVNEEIAETVTKISHLKNTVKVSESNLDFDPAKKLLSGKKVVVFGDSIIGMVRDTTSVTAAIEEFTGATVYNVGFGGCRMSVHPSTGYAAFSMWALADAVSSGTYTTQESEAASGSDYFASQLAILESIDFAAVDMIVIHYGTNDFGAGVTMDNSADDDDTSTVCGALRYSIRKIQAAYPKIRIFVSVPIYRMWDSTGAEDYTNSAGDTLPPYISALKDVAAEFNLPVIDGYQSLGINATNDSAWSSDGTHLNDYGRRVFGELIGGSLICSQGQYVTYGEMERRISSLNLGLAADETEMITGGTAASGDTSVSLGIFGASIGQVPTVKAVDDNGIPTEWGASDHTEPLIGTTDTITPTEVYNAVASGRDVVITYTDSTFGALIYTGFANSESMGVTVANMIAQYYGTYTMGYLLGTLVGNSWTHTITPFSTAADARSLGITGASAGQVPVVKSVDENGIPTEWGARDNTASYKLLNTLETTEDVAAITLDSDDNGNAYAYHEILIDYYCPASTSSAYCTMQVNGKSVNGGVMGMTYYVWSGGLISSSAIYAILQITACGDACRVEGTTGINGYGSNGAKINAFYSYAGAFSQINSIKMQFFNMSIPAGCKIKVFGR